MSDTPETGIGVRPGIGWDWDQYAGWIEMRCPYHGVPWAWIEGIPNCPHCYYSPEPAVPAVKLVKRLPPPVPGTRSCGPRGHHWHWGAPPKRGDSGWYQGRCCSCAWKIRIFLDWKPGNPEKRRAGWWREGKQEVYLETTSIAMCTEYRRNLPQTTATQ